MPRDYPTSVRFPAETKLGLMRAARKQGTTVTWLVEHICREWLDAHPVEKKRPKQEEATK